MAAAPEWLARYNAALGTSISERRELLLERFAAVGEVCTAHRKWLRVSHMIQPIRVGIERGLVAADHKIGRFATDSLLEGGGFEPSVPRQKDWCKRSPPIASTGEQGVGKIGNMPIWHSPSAILGESRAFAMPRARIRVVK